MKIQIWSDIACPFCYIGKHHLEEALEKTGLQKNVDIEWMSFQLDPSAPKSDDRSIYTILSEKYNQPDIRAREMTASMVAMGEEVGLDYDMDNLKPTNTFDAHRLIHLAKEEGKQTEMKEALFQAYFTEGKHISDTDTLTELADQVGIDPQTARDMIEGENYSDAVKADINLARQYGVQGVPFFLINGKYAISGAQPIPNFVQALNRIREEETKKDRVS